MVGMLANTKNQDHSWQKSANSGTQQGWDMSECSGGICPVLKLLVSLFGIH